jgi:hypothetical protein
VTTLREKYHREIDALRNALADEIRESVNYEAALRYYAEGGNDGGERARDTLAKFAESGLGVAP